MSPLDARRELDSCKAWVAELREQVAGLEEDNRVLVEAAGWEVCNQSEVQEEDALVVCAEKSQRIRSIDLLSDRLQAITSRVGSEGNGDGAARLATKGTMTGSNDATDMQGEGRASLELSKRSDTERLPDARRAVDGGGEATIAASESAEVVTATTAATAGVAANEEALDGVGAGGLSAEVSERLTRLEADVHRWQEACMLATDQV
ncbi:unnamed protein product, partial [Laminaria digitata]